MKKPCRLPALIMAFLFLYTSAAPAEESAHLKPEGTKYRNILLVGNKQVPLPKGEWELILSNKTLGHTTSGNLSSDRATVFLVRRDGSKVQEALMVWTNVTPTSGWGWKRNESICDRDNVHYNVSDRNYVSEAAECWQVNHNVTTYTYINNDVFWESFKNFARNRFGSATYLSADFWINDQYDAIRVHYLQLPARHGFDAGSDQSWKTSMWSPSAVKSDKTTDKQRFIDAVRTYGEKILPLLKKGFGNRLNGYEADLSFEFQK